MHASDVGDESGENAKHNRWYNIRKSNELSRLRLDNAVDVSSEMYDMGSSPSMTLLSSCCRFGGDVGASLTTMLPLLAASAASRTASAAPAAFRLRSGDAVWSLMTCTIYAISGAYVALNGELDKTIKTLRSNKNRLPRCRCNVITATGRSARHFSSQLRNCAPKRISLTSW